ncbi:MAG: tetratricopeptide repeat protein [Planctomycetes bacterium]|nr:tetratricopeptide repeat protein [Planctomycetota bacterium]
MARARADRRRLQSSEFSRASIVITILTCGFLLAGELPAPPLSARSAEESAATLNDEGVRLFEAGEFEQALDRFERAAQIDSKAPEIRANLGKARAALAILELKEHAENGGGRRPVERALEHLQRALLDWKGDADTHLALGYCRLMLGDYDGARRAFEESLALEPKGVRAARLLGVALERLGRIREAEQALARALELAGTDADVERRLRRLRFDREALEHYRVLASEHFRVHYAPDLSTRDVEAILSELERFTVDLERRWAVAAPAPIAVICYPPGEFAERTGLHSVVGGAFDGKIRIPFPKDLEEGGLALAEVARHEAAHMMLRSAGDPPPRWIDEGIAQVLDGQNRADWGERWRELMASEPEVGIETRDARYRDEDPATWGALYLHAYFLFRHLRAAASDFRLDMLVREAARGNGWEQAFTRVYGSPAADLDRAWRAASMTGTSDPPGK